VNKIIYLILIDLVTPKARAKHEPLVQRTGHWPQENPAGILFMCTMTPMTTPYTGNTKGGCITVPLTSCLTGLLSAVR